MQIGSQVGPFRVESFLGKGGMAEVYKVQHAGLARHEALKALPPALAADATFVARFLTEARTAAGLHHPNIAVIYSVSEADAPQPYFTMELVEGGDLADYLAQHGALSLEQARPLLEQIAAALDYAHRRGLMHRDVKPANILLESQGDEIRLKLVDFGLARAHEETGGTRLTSAGMIVGTPEYMSPEQGGSGAPVDHRTDIYALGVVAYEMLCGEPPFKAARDTSMLAVIMQHVRDAPRPPLELAPSLTKSANAAILRALAKEPEERFSSCGEFVKALYGSGSVAPLRTVGAPKRALPIFPMLAGAALVAGVGILGFSVWNSRNPPIVEVQLQTPQPMALAETPEVEPTTVPTEVPVEPSRQFTDVTATASLSLKAKGYDYGPTQVLDGRADTAWNTENTRHGVGEWIQLSWDGERTISRIGMVVGYDKYNDKKQYAGQPHMWFRNNRLREATLKFSSGATRKVSFKDITAMQYQQFEPVQATWCRVQVDAVYLDMFGGKQKRWDDLAIGEIQIWGHD